MENLHPAHERLWVWAWDLATRGFGPDPSLAWPLGSDPLEAAIAFNESIGAWARQMVAAVVSLGGAVGTTELSAVEVALQGVEARWRALEGMLALAGRLPAGAEHAARVVRSAEQDVRRWARGMAHGLDDVRTTGLAPTDGLHFALTLQPPAGLHAFMAEVEAAARRRSVPAPDPVPLRRAGSGLSLTTWAMMAIGIWGLMGDD